MSAHARRSQSPQPPPPPPQQQQQHQAAAAGETTLEPVVSKMERFVLYETHAHMYLVGCDKLQSQYR
jgi:hypothetical protein